MLHGVLLDMLPLHVEDDLIFKPANSLPNGGRNPEQLKPFQTMIPAKKFPWAVEAGAALNERLARFRPLGLAEGELGQRTLLLRTSGNALSATPQILTAERVSARSRNVETTCFHAGGTWPGVRMA